MLVLGSSLRGFSVVIAVLLSHQGNKKKKKREDHALQFFALHLMHHTSMLQALVPGCIVWIVLDSLIVIIHCSHRLNYELFTA